MGALTIRNIDDAIVAAIKQRAGERGISMEEEIRRMLASTYAGGDQQASGKEWARQQLDRLKRGELVKSDTNSVDEIREMRGSGREALRQRLNDSIARGGVLSEEQLDAAIARTVARLTKAGF